MRQWSWLPHKGSSWGSATPVENRGTKLQSVGVVVGHNAPTKEQYTSTPIQGERSPKKVNKKLNLRIYRVD